MKLLWFVIAAALVAVLSVPILNHMLDDEPRSRRDLMPGESRGKREQSPKTTSKSGSIYRWRDENGVLHIESNPPHATAYEVIRYEYQPAATSKQVSESDASSSEAAPRREAQSHPLSVYSPEGVERLLDEADQTARRIDARRKVLDDLKRDL